MKECNVNPNTISNVRKTMLGFTADSSLIGSPKGTTESLAFQLFQQGKSLIDVKVELDVESTEVAEYYGRYQELRFLSEFNRAYDSVKGNIAPILHLFDLMNGPGMMPEQVEQQVRYGDNYHSLKILMRC